MPCRLASDVRTHPETRFKAACERSFTTLPHVDDQYLVRTPRRPGTTRWVKHSTRAEESVTHKWVLTGRPLANTVGRKATCSAS